MMDYEMFKQVFGKAFKEKIKELFNDVDIVEETIQKVNVKSDALSVVKKYGESSLGPNVYFNEMFDLYTLCGDLDKVVNGAVSMVFNALNNQIIDPAADMFKPDKAKDCIVMELINTELNKELLERLPHREFRDLSVIYRWVIDNGSMGITSCIVNNNMAEDINLSEEQLFEIAKENTIKMFPIQIEGLKNIMSSMISDLDIPEEEKREIRDGEFKDIFQSEDIMYTISNTHKCKGAVGILYEEYLHDFSEKLGKDIYILPSSIHECMLVPDGSAFDIDFMSELIMDANKISVAPHELLSNQIYRYDKEARTISVVTDNPPLDISKANKFPLLQPACIR